MRIDDKDVATRIKAIRLSKGLTLEEFGKSVGGADKSIVSRWELGKSKPTPTRLKMIAQLGDITVEELVFGKLSDLTNFTTDELLDEIKRRLSQ